MALGSLIGAAFVRISADTDPAEKAIKSLSSIGASALSSALLPAANVAAVGVGAIAVAFGAATVAAGAFAAAVKPQITDVTNAAKQYQAIATAQQQAELAASQAHKLATSSNVAYENALTAATAAHEREQQASIDRSKEYANVQAAQTAASAASAQASELAAKGGTAYERARTQAAKDAAQQDVTSAKGGKAYADAIAAATKATATARALASQGGTAYENALAAAAKAHAGAQDLAAASADKYRASQTDAAQASLNAEQLATSGGKAYVAALAKVQAANKAVSDAQAAYNQTLAGMPPATRQTAVAYAGLTDAVKKWSDSLSGSTMPVFTLGIQKIQGLLPKLTPIVKAVGADLLSFLENLDSGTAGKVFDSFGKDLGGLASGSLTDFLNIAKNLAVGFAGILDSFTPMASKVTGGLAQLSGKFAEWGATAGSTSGVQSFFAMAKKEAPQLGSDLEKIATAATHIGGGLGPLSGIGLKVAGAFASILQALPVPVLNQVVNIIVATNLAMKAYALYTSLAAAATWLFSTATGASRVQMALLRVQMALIYIQYRLQALWSGIVTAATWLWNTSLVTSVVTLVSSTASMVARNVALGASAVATGVVTAATWLWTAALGPAVAAIWAMTTALLASPITWIVIGIGLLIAAIVLIATKTTWFQTAWKYSWNFIKQAASDAWNFIDNWVVKPFMDAFNSLWNDVLQPVFKFIIDAFLNMASVLINGAASMFGWIPGVGGKLKQAAKAFDDFRDSVNDSLGGIKPKNIPVTIKFNGVPEGTITGHSYTSTTGFSYAGGGPVQGPGTETSDDVPALLSDNEHVWTAKEVRAAGGHRNVAAMRKAVLSRGLGMFSSGGAVGDDAQKMSLSVTQPTAAAVANGMKVSAAEVVTRTTNQITQAYIKASKGVVSSLGGAIPTKQHLSVINAAMAAAGVPPPGTSGEWQTGLNTLIGRESGWNANAINRWDSNAQAGHPSQGLAQTIPSTFEHYVPSSLRSLGILNPVANVAAAIRYIVSRYGNITRVQQANANLPPQGYDVGGWLMPGATLAVNNTGRPERVLGPKDSIGGTLNLTVNVNAPIGSQAQMMNWLVASLVDAQRTGRLRGILPGTG